MGLSSSGKSTYINEHKQPEDLVIDVLHFQKDNAFHSVLAANYLLLANLEYALRRYKNTNQVIWVENTFLRSFRRKILLDFSRTLSEEIGCEIEYNLIYITCTPEEYIRNRRARFASSNGIKDEELISQYQYEMKSTDNPMEYDKELNWNTINII